MKKNKSTPEAVGLYERIYEREAGRRSEEAEERAQKLNAYERTVANRRNRAVARFIAAFLLMSVIICTLTYALYKVLFVISEVRFTGNTVYSFEELYSATGIEKGDNLYSFSSRVVGERVKSLCPYVKTLTVTRSVPNKISFAVEEHRAAFYAHVYGETLILSEDLTVLGVSEEEKNEGLCLLKLPPVERAVAGERIVLRAKMDSDHLKTVSEAIISSSLYGRIGAVDMTDPFKLDMQCDGQFLLVFGTYDDCDIRLRVADAVLSDEMFSGTNKARLDLSDASETSVMIDNTLVFD